jgi:hypothetical protein
MYWCDGDHQYYDHAQVGGDEPAQQFAGSRRNPMSQLGRKAGRALTFVRTSLVALIAAAPAELPIFFGPAANNAPNRSISARSNAVHSTCVYRKYLALPGS